MKTFDASGYGPGPDLTRPGPHWRKIIRAGAAERGITHEEAAEAICEMYRLEFHEAIRESAKGNDDGS